jgi:protein-disulfide isomerase
MRAFWLLMAVLLAAAPAWAGDKDAEFKEQLRQALKENPGLILQVLEEHKVALYNIARRGAQEDQDRRWRQNLAKALDKPLKMTVDDSRPIKGPKDARFTIIEFSNFMCSACAVGAENMAKLIKKHPSQIRLQMRHNPSDDFARQLAVYFEAIGRQDRSKAWSFAKRVFQRQDDLRKRKMEAVQEIVNSLKLDQAKLSRDLADKTLETYIKEDEAEADRLKFQSTPTFVVNGVAITGAAPINIFEQVMAQWNARHGKTQAKPKPKAQAK